MYATRHYFRVMEKTRGRKAKERLDEIKSLYKLGKITYDHAKDLAEEYLVVLNEEMEKIARDFKRKHRKVGFVSFMR